MVELVQRLSARGPPYEQDGSTYFRISSFPGYGRLSGIDPDRVKPGARVDSDEYEKEDVRDFVLWKAAKPGEPAWDSALGPGRPGWHLECSAMAMALLGESLDIHTGGVDNIFPHHENEIAQSEAATGKPFVRTWLHAEHLIVEGQKMAKSLGNFFTLRDLLERGHDPAAIRYLLVSVPYRQKLNFTFDGLHAAAAGVERIGNTQRRLAYTPPATGDGDLPPAEVDSFTAEFDAGLADDLNTARALGASHRYSPGPTRRSTDRDHRRLAGWLDARARTGRHGARYPAGAGRPLGRGRRDRRAGRRTHRRPQLPRLRAGRRDPQ
jgi:cysteinyl-tRNA synthetase